MSKFHFLFLLLLITTAASAQENHPPHQAFTWLDAERAQPEREVRAAWLTTLKGLDWPRRYAKTEEGAEVQKQDLQKILDQLQAAGINTVLFQSRIRSTTAYSSEIEPWDGIFTGTEGKEPSYDPLAFAIEECHKRGMELHAWVVAFPICKVANAKKLGKKALPRLRPELCQRCGDQWMMEPGVPETADYLAEICKEIASKYDVDGIHLDYIRYPEKGIAFNDNKTYRKYGKGMPKADWRRENVTRCVEKIHAAVKSVRPWAKLSCSPVGKFADLPRQSSYGWNARNAVYQDAKAWLRDGIMDMLFPMMYFDGKHFYPFALDWQEQSYGRLIVPGLGIYFLHPREKNWDLNIIRRQMYFLRDAGLGGQALFRSKFFTENVKGLYDFAANDFYRQPALPQAMTWADSIAPASPKAVCQLKDGKLHLQWEASTDNTPQAPIYYNVYRLQEGERTLQGATLLAQRLQTQAFDVEPSLPIHYHAHYAVVAMDAYGNESEPAIVNNDSLSLKQDVLEVEHTLPLPKGETTNFVLVCDIEGRELFARPHVSEISVDHLARGLYELRALLPKGESRRLLFFRKK